MNKDKIRKGCWLLVLGLVLYLAPSCVYGAGEEPVVSPEVIAPQEEADAQENEESSKEDYQDSLLQDMELNEVQDAMDEMLQENSFSFFEAVKNMMTGEMPISKESVSKLLVDVLNAELGNQRGRFVNILILVLISAVLTNFTSVFSNNQLSEICFYMVYLMLFALLIKNFSTLSIELSGNLKAVVEFMRALTPAYYIAIVASGGITSATIFYQVILIVVFCVEYILVTIILPGINIYLLMGLINLLTKEAVLTKIADLLKTVLTWAMKSMLAVIVGLQIIQGLVAPAIDSLKQSLLGKTVSVIPGVGNAMSAVTEIILASAVLVRNCLGVAALIGLIVMCVAPIIKLALSAFLYKLLGALIQPIADKRMVGCLHAVGDGCGLLLKLLFTTQVLFMLTIVILANTLR